MGDDLLAGPSNDNVGVADSVGALWSIGGGAWLVFVFFVVVILLGVICLMANYYFCDLFCLVLIAIQSTVK